MVPRQCRSSQNWLWRPKLIQNLGNNFIVFLFLRGQNHDDVKTYLTLKIRTGSTWDWPTLTYIYKAIENLWFLLFYQFYQYTNWIHRRKESPEYGRGFAPVRWLRYSLEIGWRSSRTCWTHLTLQFLRIHWTRSQPRLLHLLQTLPIQNRNFFLSKP